MGTPSTVNYIGHLNAFYHRLRNDKYLSAIDVSLYLALFQIWNSCRFENPFHVGRSEAMQLSRIGSGKTYNASLRTLEECGYIGYIPPEKPFMRSTICMRPMSRITTHTHNINDTHTHTQNDTYTGEKVPRLYKQSKQIKNESKHARAYMKNVSKNPDLEEIKRYFTSQGQPGDEGARFFYYYQSIGWSQRGNPITDWPAAAQKWIGNISLFAKPAPKPKPHHLHIDQKKNYEEPL